MVMPVLMAVKSGIPQCCVPVNHRPPARRYRWVGKASYREEPGCSVAGSAQDDADLRWLREAVELSKRCQPSDSAFSVGAVLVGGGDAGGGQDGRVIATGYSRQRDPHDHAEEVALADAGPAASGGTVYTSLEPCLRRLSRSRSCAELIVAAGVRRVVLAWREPPR